MTALAGLKEALTGRPFAHRGLWSDAAPENSLAAFEAACSAGYGIELDIQLSADGEAMVFHDETLERMTAQAGIVEERSAAELGALELLGTEQTIPTLAQALECIAGRAMVLIELKTPPGQEGLLEQRGLELVQDYNGPFAFIGFNIQSHAWLARHAPDLPRGLDLERADDPAPAKPHFLLPSLAMMPHKMVQDRRAGGLPVVGWTVRSEIDLKHARPFCDNIIFEGLRP